jgi:hypothetical protein
MMRSVCLIMINGMLITISPTPNMTTIQTNPKLLSTFTVFTDIFLLQSREKLYSSGESDGPCKMSTWLLLGALSFFYILCDHSIKQIHIMFIHGMFGSSLLAHECLGVSDGVRQSHGPECR